MEPQSSEEIKTFYEANGWHKTISKFHLSPKQASIILKGKKKAKMVEKQDTESEILAPKKKKKKIKKMTNGESATASATEAPYGYKADGTPKKRPGRKAGSKNESKPEKKSAKANGRSARKLPSGDLENVFQWLLSYRKRLKAPETITLDNLIADLAAKTN